MTPGERADAVFRQAYASRVSHDDHARHIREHLELRDALYRQAGADMKQQIRKTYYQEEDIMPNDFHPITIYLTSAQIKEVQEGEFDMSEALDLITEAVPPAVHLEERDVIEYETGHKYQVVRLEGDSVLLRRVTASTAGPNGSLLVERLAKTKADILSGKAERL